MGCGLVVYKFLSKGFGILNKQALSTSAVKQKKQQTNTKVEKFSPQKGLDTWFRRASVLEGEAKVSPGST